ncbi:glycosyltransferase [Enterococcus gilvus]|uniref:glycosyltransferase n=1 Tax=Enterococcus gilvus TaxID=160453 RepID=UPI00290905EB|nr:glycosyltransferase [Enterococcus gilvus]MDU5511466.1 glycosyltransferase [Enterococcus gilvus]
MEHHNRFKRIVVSTHSQKADIQKRFPHIENISVIPVAYLDNDDIKELSLAPNPLRLISVARYDPSKKLEHQLRLIKKLKKDYPNIELHMFGFGDRRYVNKLIEEMDIKENIFVRGFIKDIEPEYGKSVLSLCTSSFEGFCLAVFESIKYHVPCISYDIRYGPNEIISDKINGFLIESNNEDQLYLTVKEFLDTHGNNLSMDRSAFEESFSKEKVKDKWNALINSI